VPGQPCCFVRRDVTARLDMPTGGAYDIACQYYPIDPALRAAAIDIPGDDWIAHRSRRTGGDAP